ncbi:MAG: site-specific DNA-methyltransferase [Phycisphaerales bacterium]|nr:site-specific DNA-methyltransferase [Phycisphaerales bacterium]MCB9837089.1 site-specific DNA-methyltransferase [Phycisphaera sp.]
MTDSARVIHGSCESMRELEDGSITLTVTSPPYFDAMDYTKFDAKDRSKHKARTYAEGFDGYQSYLSLMQRIAGELYRVTKPGGVCAIVAGSIQSRGRCYPIPTDLSQRFRDLGWELFHELVWHKGRSALDRAGVFVQHPYPGYFHPNVLTESILVFRKPGPRIFAGVEQETKDSARMEITPLVTRDLFNNVWAISPVPPGRLDHPCPFPEEVPHRLISLYSYPGDLVLDPFAGSGQTLKVARALGRRAIGYELESQFVELARQRSAEPMQLRERQLILRTEAIEGDPFVTRHKGDRAA